MATVSTATPFPPPGFGRFWVGESVSGFGNYVTVLALQTVVVLTLHGTATQVGWLNSTRWLPYLVVGLVVGALARFLLPGDQKMGWILTCLLGIGGSLVAGFVGQGLGWYQAGEPAGWIASVVGAIVLLFIVSKLRGSSNPS